VISATYVAAENRKKLEALAEHFDLTCATCTRVQGFGSEIALRDQPQPVSYRLIGLDAVGDPASTTRYRLRGLRKVIRDVSADVILVESEPWALIRWQAWFWKKIHRPRALFGEFSWENIERRGFKGWLLRCCYRAAAATDDFVIAGNADAGGSFLRRGTPAPRVLVSPQLGVDADVFRPATEAERARLRDEMGIPAAAFCVGFCGRLVEEKGVPDLVQAVENARGKMPAGEICLVILGHGRLGDELQKKAALAPWLRLLPARAQSEIAPFFQALDLFVLPSKEVPGVWKEQFGHVLIQAMSAGVPVLGSDSGEIPRVIGDPAQIFSAGNPADLAQAIARMAANADARKRTVASQLERVHANFTNRAIAADWSSFLKSLPGLAPSAKAVSWVCLTDTSITHEEAGPRRYLQLEEDKRRNLILCGLLAAGTEQQLQHGLRWLKNTERKQRFFRLVGLLNIFRHYFRLRRTPVIYCGCPHYFWWLMLLNRFRLFPVRNRLIFNYCFRSNSFLSKAKWWNRAPENFCAVFVSRDQVAQLEAQGIRRGGIRYFPCQVDTEWFRIGPPGRGGYLIVPGNIHRDEEFILRLAKISPLPIIRVGQMGRLKDIYRSSPVELRFNLSHPEFLDLLQNATAVLLPIEPCDEPAGLTAALEAFACGIPLLANPSLEIEPLLRNAVGIETIPTSDPEAWATAIRGILDGTFYPKETRIRGREFVVANHSIGSQTSVVTRVLESIASTRDRV
jgi:glycosyltransferase involved in cell wall biosynthesis